MRKILVASLGAALFSSAAIAADMPVKAPVYLPPPPTWTGFYVGGNIGYSWGEARTDITGNGSTTAFPPTWFAPSPGFPTSFAFADSNKAGLDGVIGGGQIGYNFQLTRNWVVGIEADLQGSGERGSGAFADPFSTPICSAVSILVGPATTVNCFGTSPLTGTALTSYDAKIDWFGTLRGRFGFLLTDQFLIYGTGGLAYGQVELSGSNTIAALINSPAVPSNVFTPSIAAFNASKTNVGYSVGAGVEGSIWLPAKWRWKVEYLYLDLGSLNAGAPFALSSISTQFPPPTGTMAMHARFTDQIVRVGLNYGF